MASYYKVVAWVLLIVFIILLIIEFIIGAVYLYKAWKHTATPQQLKNIFIAFLIIAVVAIILLIIVGILNYMNYRREKYLIRYNETLAGSQDNSEEDIYNDTRKILYNSDPDSPENILDAIAGYPYAKKYTYDFQ